MTQETVFITDEAEQKLSAYLRKAEGEISGFGTIDSKDGLIVVNDIFILPQEASGGHTDLDIDAMQDLLYELLQKGKDPSEVSLWWHSHSNFNSFFSQTDENTIERFANFNRPWMLSLVSNQRLQHRLRIDFYSPIRVTAENLELRMFSRINQNVDRRIEAEIRRKVRKPAPVVPLHEKYGGNGWSSQQKSYWQGKLGGGDIEKDIEEFLAAGGMMLSPGHL